MDEEDFCYCHYDHTDETDEYHDCLDYMECEECPYYYADLDQVVKFTERLTTNKEKSEMGMYELAHNCCYCKDGLARYRDFENDIDARELTRRILKNFADSDDAFVDDDDFDEEMLELLKYETSTIEGLIALFYRNMWAMANLRERLNEYENLEEQGLLLRLPCPIGTTVYNTTLWDDVTEKVEVDGKTFYRIAHKHKVSKSTFSLGDIYNFGKTVFLTQEEAEQKLKEMESD